MTQLVWDAVGERFYETGVDRGVLYIPDNFGVYNNGYAWNGLVSVTESPTGAEASPQYADNIKYLNLISAEDFEGSIEAFTYPREFGQCDGTAEPTPGILVGQQARKSFGLSYRTKVGNDTEGQDFAYKIHLVYGALAAPSEKAYNTVNDSPEAITFSWDLTTTPVAVPGLKPTAILTIQSNLVDADALAALEEILYGTPGSNPRLPIPAEVFDLFQNTVVTVETVNPTYNEGTKVITLPSVTGVQYKVAGVNKSAGAQPAITVDTIVTAHALEGYKLDPLSDNSWTYRA